MVKPREKNERYVDAVMTVPKVCVYVCVCVCVCHYWEGCECRDYL